MEKIRLRAVCAFIVGVFSCAVVFADGEKYKVTFDADGGAPKPASIDATSGESLGDKLPDGSKMTKKDFVFECWQTEDGTEFKNKDQVMFPLTLKAKWTALYTVTFDTQGGKPVSEQQQSVKDNNSISKMPDTPEREWYQFLGWYYKNAKDKDKEIEFNTDVSITNNMTVYAKWESDFSIINKKIDALDGKIEVQKKNIGDIPGWMFFGIPVGVLVVLIIIHFVFSSIGLKKINKAIPDMIQKRFDELHENQNTVEQALDAHKREILAKLERSAAGENPRSSPAVHDNSAQHEAEIARLQRRITELEAQNRDLQDDKNISSGIARGTLDPLAAFNTWAANPQEKLPGAFYYIEGDMKIRTTRTLSESNNPDSKWITSREGKKYLFPNPNAFDRMTASDFLYKISGTAKPKGQNKIRITKPCAMNNDGFVEFAGELEIL